MSFLTPYFLKLLSYVDIDVVNDKMLFILELFYFSRLVMRFIAVKMNGRCFLVNVVMYQTIPVCMVRRTLDEIREPVQS